MSEARMTWRPLRWLFSRHAAKTLLWLVLVVAAAVLTSPRLPLLRRKQELAVAPLAAGLRAPP